MSWSSVKALYIRGVLSAAVPAPLPVVCVFFSQLLQPGTLNLATDFFYVGFGYLLSCLLAYLAWVAAGMLQCFSR